MSGRYGMDGLEPPICHDDDLADRIEQSDVYRERALEWYADNFHRYSDACDQAAARFRTSDAFDTLYDDVVAGEVSIDDHRLGGAA